MIAYYIHWIYPPEADEELFYGGRDDLDNLFYHEENAEKFAKEEMTKYEEDEKRYDYLNKKDDEEGLTPEERDEFTDLLRRCCGDNPYGYAIRKKEFKFKDEL